MPTYKNDSPVTKNIFNIDNVLKTVAPGESIQTYSFLSADNGWTQTSINPIYNPILLRQILTLNADPGITVSFDPALGKRIYIKDATGTISGIYNEDASITPAIFENITSSSPTLMYDNSDGYMRKIILKGSGTCIIEIHKN